MPAGRTGKHSYRRWQSAIGTAQSDDVHAVCLTCMVTLRFLAPSTGDAKVSEAVRLAARSFTRRPGVPAVPVPLLVDQPFRAYRLRRLGVAPEPVHFEKLTAETLIGG